MKIVNLETITDMQSWCRTWPHNGSRRIHAKQKLHKKPREAWKSWLFVHVRKLHLPPSRWTQSQSLLAERRIIPYSTVKHWCIQNYSYEFGCQARETHRWLVEYRWVRRFVWSLDRFHTIYFVGRKKSWRIYVVQREINKKTAHIQARSSMARTLEINGKARQAEGEEKVVWGKAPPWKRTKIARDLFHRPGGYGIQRNHQERA